MAAERNAWTQDGGVRRRPVSPEPFLDLDGDSPPKPAQKPVAVVPAECILISVAPRAGCHLHVARNGKVVHAVTDEIEFIRREHPLAFRLAGVLENDAKKE